MTLYSYIVFVVTSLVGNVFSYTYGSSVVSRFPLYPVNSMTGFNALWDTNYIYNHGGFLFNRWSEVISDKTTSWWNQIASDPSLLMSTIIWCLCVWITVELCLILPFRWFKRLLRYPNHKLMTPQEVKRSKLK